MSALRSLLILSTLLATSALAEIRYSVQPTADNSRIKVTMKFEAPAGPVELQMPNWAPGAYILSVPGRNVRDLKWLDAAGTTVAFEHPADHAWKGTLRQAGTTTLEYTVPAQFAAGALHYSGPSAYLYVVGRKEEACRLSFQVPQGWNIAIGLDSIGGSKTEYRAKTYDVLADNPATLGDFIELRYIALGKPHFLAIRGAAKDRADKEQLQKLCRHVTESQAKFFGGLPYSKYVWHLNITGGQGGGGLEHLSSTAISTGTAVTPGTAGLFSHEYFHLWNVKRIRSKVLGPFDYTQLPKTGALWWLEGTTDYYADLLLLRFGWYKESDFFSNLISNNAAVRTNAAYREVSPHESSLRVGETNGGRGNSNGYRISYYNLGWLAGLCLDLDLRARTNGRRSLDDVTRALWQICKDDKPGFEEDEIRRQYLRFGGSGEFYDRVVMKPGPMPIEECLSTVGLKLVEGLDYYVDKGFDLAPIFGGNGVRVSGVRPFGATAGLAVDDVVLAIDGKPLSGATSMELIASANNLLGTPAAGQTLRLRIRRAGNESDVSVTAQQASRPAFKVVDAAYGDAKKLDLRKGWYFGK